MRGLSPETYSVLSVNHRVHWNYGGEIIEE